MKNRKIHLLLSLFVITIATGAIWLKLSNHQPQAVKSRADESTPHWSHVGMPAVVPIYNSLSSQMWKKHLAVLANSWEQSEVIDFQISSPNGYPCYAGYPGVIAVCSFNNPNDPFIFWSYYYYNEANHMTGAELHLNDAYLNSNTPYGTTVWRNYILCSQLGFLVGLVGHYSDDPNDTSCMNYQYNSEEDLVTRQFPNTEDLDNIKILYSSHSDNLQPKPASIEYKDIDKLLQTNDLGTLIESSQNGKDQLYEKDLDNGNSMRIRVLRK